MEDKLVFSVSQLNNYVKNMLDGDPNLQYIYVVGEISNFTNHYKSGHFYLTLKDDKALVKAVMFRSDAQRIKFLPKDGMKVICRGRATMFERDGQFQFYINDMQPDGVGALQLAFEQLTEKLKAEGLFDREHKKPIPKYPERVAVITSPTGAAVQDLKNVLFRRCPSVEIIMCPVLVQGDGAPEQLIDAVERVNRLDLADTIIIGRGGGSLEDLWAFNNEQLARTIFNSHIPVISAVGHETDFTICDFVADLRAPTPSAAAELAVTDTPHIESRIADMQRRLKMRLSRIAADSRHRLDLVTESRAFRSPMQFTDRLRERLDYICRDAATAYGKCVSSEREKLSAAAAKLNALSPLLTLSRGYSLALKDSNPVRSVSEIGIGESITVKLADGSAECEIMSINTEE